jgi:hypothetical protein
VTKQTHTLQLLSTYTYSPDHLAAHGNRMIRRRYLSLQSSPIMQMCHEEGISYIRRMSRRSCSYAWLIPDQAEPDPYRYRFPRAHGGPHADEVLLQS